MAPKQQQQPGGRQPPTDLLQASNVHSRTPPPALTLLSGPVQPLRAERSRRGAGVFRASAVPGRAGVAMLAVAHPSLLPHARPGALVLRGLLPPVARRAGPAQARRRRASPSVADALSRLLSPRSFSLRDFAALLFAQHPSLEVHLGRLDDIYKQFTAYKARIAWSRGAAPTFSLAAQPPLRSITCPRSAQSCCPRRWTRC